MAGNLQRKQFGAKADGPSDVRRLQDAQMAGILRPGERLSEISKVRAAQVLRQLDTVQSRGSS